MPSLFIFDDKNSIGFLADRAFVDKGDIIDYTAEGARATRIDGDAELSGKGVVCHSAE